MTWGRTSARSCRSSFGIVFASSSSEEAPRWLFRMALLALPLPWIAIEVGWFVAEFGRQPWIIEGMLPTFLATSELGVYNLILTIAGFTIVYGILAVIEVRLMLAAIQKGPEIGKIFEGMSPGPGRQPAGEPA